MRLDVPPMHLKEKKKGQQELTKHRAGSAQPEFSNVNMATPLTTIHSGNGAIYAIPTNLLPGSGGMVHTQFRSAAPMAPLPMQAGINPLQTHGATTVETGDTHELDIPPSAYDRVSDFLETLEKAYDDPDCKFTEHIDVLCSKNYLGFRRICDIVNAVPESSAPGAGGRWLKDRMEEQFHSITEGDAQAIFQGMAKRVRSVNKGWTAKQNAGLQV
jgi:hypothetical protein